MKVKIERNSTTSNLKPWNFFTPGVTRLLDLRMKAQIT